MLFEKRRYTLRPGCLAAFLEAQQVRGFEVARPILDRLIGYFHTPFGPQDEITHLYRFDSYDDWLGRLHGLYGVPGLDSYFRTVRPLMLAQENEILAPAPLAALTPYWGGGRDAQAGPTLAVPPIAFTDALVLEESNTVLLPGQLPAYWERTAELLQDAQAAEAATAGLLGVFTTVVGTQHKVTSWRWHASLQARDANAAALRALPAWQAFEGGVRPSVASYRRKLQAPAPLAEMSPLFRR